MLNEVARYLLLLLVIVVLFNFTEAQAQVPCACTANYNQLDSAICTTGIYAVLASDGSGEVHIFGVSPRSAVVAQSGPGPSEQVNVWICHCIDEGGVKTCELEWDHNPHLAPGTVLYWEDGLCIFVGEPEDLDCQDATPHNPSCI